jgi:hypothetical protein
LNCNSSIASTNPPQPIVPNPPPNLPLDGSIFFLLIGAILIASYKVYWHVKNQYKSA